MPASIVREVRQSGCPAAGSSNAVAATPARPTEDSIGRGERRPELDGLRAIAILLVMFHHMAPRSGALAWLGRASAEAGWMGVDLFFVLSGFLITCILCQSAGREHYYRSFLARRALRIVPLYLAYLACTAIASYRFAPAQWAAFLQWGGLTPYLLYCANVWASIRHAQPPIAELTSLWSLQVEEQFYLAYPLVIAVCPSARLRPLLAACAALALAGRCIAAGLGASALTAYVNTPFRMDSLALGGVVATLYLDGTLRRWTAACRGVCCLGAAVIVTLCATHRIYHEELIIRTAGFTIIALTFAAVLALTLLGDSDAIARALRLPPLVYSGQIAYGLYILHRPAWAIVHKASRILAVSPATEFVLGVALAYGLASLSWHLFESKILKLKQRFKPGAERTAGRDRRALRADLRALFWPSPK